jgi:hypothetical protein
MSLNNTRMQNLRSASNIDKNELRASRYGAFDMFMQQTKDPAGIITPELSQKAAASIGRVLETPVIQYDAGIGISGTRSVTIADNENSSVMHTITFQTYSWGFTQVPSMFMNNEVSMQRDFEAKFNRDLFKFGATLDSACISGLSVAKTQVFQDSLNYPVTGNVLQSTWAKRDNLIGDFNPMLEANDHFGEIHLLGNGGLQSIINKLDQKGVYNSENKRLEFLDKILHYSNRIGNASGEYANMYAVNGGSVGLIARFEREALLNTVMADGTSWGIDTLPMLNFPVGTYYYESKGNFSSIGGASTADMDRVRKQHFGYAVDVAVITTYNSAPSTIANPIMKATVLDEV